MPPKNSKTSSTKGNDESQNSPTSPTKSSTSSPKKNVDLSALNGDALTNGVGLPQSPKRPTNSTPNRESSNNLSEFIVQVANSSNPETMTVSI